MEKRICAITMVRDGSFFLRKWVDWYGSEFGKDNLYIFFDGQDQVPPAFTEGCNVRIVPRVEGQVSKADKGRIAILSDCARTLLDRYDFVIGTDVDEFITPDPSLGVSLSGFLSSLDVRGRKAFSPLGCDVVQNTSCEGALDWQRPVLGQRSFALLSTRYTKASILCAKASWGSGFHRVRGSDFKIIPGLFLFHFGCADAAGILSRISDPDLSTRGWDRHLRKRYRLLRTVSRLPARDWDLWT
ncbi:MAG: glycosyltransferase family 2 protein, partial [Bacteroidales bacterium]|nr:glycosyltransferase family 2 protein [Bacteroidales bacterium]